jgi:hypothetical protein
VTGSKVGDQLAAHEWIEGRTRKREAAPMMMAGREKIAATCVTHVDLQRRMPMPGVWHVLQAESAQDTVGTSRITTNTVPYDLGT